MPRTLLCLLLIVPSLWAQSTTEDTAAPKPTRIWLHLDAGYTRMSPFDSTSSGLELQAAVGFQINDRFAWGGVFNRYSSSRTGFSGRTGWGYSEWVSVKDDISIKFFGPALFYRNLNPSSTMAFIAFVSGGYLGYTDDRTEGTSSRAYVENSLGLLIGIGGEFYLGKSAAIGVECRSLTGSVSKPQIYPVSGEMNLARFSLNAGLHLAF